MAQIIKNVYAYQIEDGGCGFVIADDIVEAEKKIREAYNEHGYLSDTTEIEIYKPSWFEDVPDVFEVSDGR